jgi:membrane protein DedA with SNARE-associated domain
LYALIGALAALENVLPIIPADTVVALGAFLAGRGVLDGWVVFGVTASANVASTTAVYALARRYGVAFFRGPLGRRLLPESIMVHIQRAYQRHGTYGLFLSRLLPVWRAVVPPFAGIVGLSPWRAIPPLALASTLWYGVLTWLIVRLGRDLDQVLRLLQQANRVLGAVALLTLVTVAMLVWRRLKR